MSESPSKPIKIELAVNTCGPEDVKKLETLLTKIQGLSIYDLDPNNKTITLDISKSCQLCISDIQTNIENNTGISTVVKGVGTSQSAVSELRPSNTNRTSDENIFGVIRFSQIDKKCYVDGLIDGFLPHSQKKHYCVGIHEYGDLSGKDYENIGESMIDLEKKLEISNENNVKKLAIPLKKEIDDCHLASLIGRAVAVCAIGDNNTCGKYVSAGIISRASTINSNTKQICACSGKTIWQERLEKIGK